MDSKRVIEVKRNILAANDEAADAFRAARAEDGTFFVDVMASPGAGKTTILLAIIKELRSRGVEALGVIEKAILLFREQGKTGERFAGTIERLSFENVEAQLLDSGLLQETLRPLDISLDGAGFFNIQDEEGEIYLTRNGGFDIDSEGYLYLKGSGRVMGKNGPLKVNTSDFTVTSDGTVYNAENQRIDQILVTWPGVDQVEKYSNGLYRAKEGSENADTPWADAKVAQGFLETSGLDVNREWVQVMEANRALQACSTALKTIDEMTQKAATTIAKL